MKKNNRWRHQAEKSQSFSFIFLLKLFLFFILMSVIIWGAHLLRDPFFMPLRDIKVFSNFQHVDSSLLEENIAPVVAHQSFFTVNTEKIRQQLLQLPWVDEVLIRRVWPDQLDITVREQQAFARWNDDSLLNFQGDIFSPSATSFPAGLPELRGPLNDQQAVFQQYQQLQASLTPLQLHLSKLSVDSRDSWRGVLNNGLQVFLGRENILARWNRWIAIYPKLMANQKNALQSVDLRYADGFATQWAAREGLK